MAIVLAESLRGRRFLTSKEAMPMIEWLERTLSMLASLATIACFVIEAAKVIQYVRKEGKGSKK